MDQNLEKQSRLNKISNNFRNFYYIFGFIIFIFCFPVYFPFIYLAQIVQAFILSQPKNQIKNALIMFLFPVIYQIIVLLITIFSPQNGLSGLLLTQSFFYLTGSIAIGLIPVVVGFVRLKIQKNREKSQIGS